MSPSGILAILQGLRYLPLRTMCPDPAPRGRTGVGSPRRKETRGTTEAVVQSVEWTIFVTLDQCLSDILTTLRIRPIGVLMRARSSTH